MDTVYHPNRARQFYESEPFSTYLQQTIALTDGMRAEGNRAAANLVFVTDMIMDGLAPELSAANALPGLLDYLNEEGQAMESSVSAFHSTGSNIFDVSPLAEMFRHTSVDEVSVQDLKLPFDAFYIHFGRAATLPSPHTGVFVDGCYIQSDEEYISLHFVCTFIAAEAMESLPPVERFQRFARGYTCLLFLDQTIPENVASCSTREWCHSAPWWEGFLAEPLRIAVNALCYLNYDKREVEATWPERAPARLVRQTQSPKPTERRRTESKLNALGFSIVNLCGRRLAQEAARAAVGTSPRSHWRRGHWRHQAHGPARAQRRLTWIWPTMVGAGALPEEVAGHVYRCEPGGHGVK